MKTKEPMINRTISSQERLPFQGKYFLFLIGMIFKYIYIYNILTRLIN